MKRHPSGGKVFRDCRALGCQMTRTIIRYLSIRYDILDMPLSTLSFSALVYLYYLNKNKLKGAIYFREIYSLGIFKLQAANFYLYVHSRSCTKSGFDSPGPRL